ncbi:MAG: diguanylate cyclase [Phormidesmis sp.]
MFLRENLYVIILCMTAIVSSCVALTAWVRRDVTVSTRPLVWLMGAIAAYAAAAAASEIAQSVHIYHGAGDYWIATCFYTYVVTGSLWVTRSALRSSRLHQQQAVIIVAGSLLPLIAGTLFTLGISPHHANILPMSFLITGLIYFANLFQFHLFDLLPVARDVLIERMNDGVLVVNRKNCVVDINPAAREYVRSPKGACSGQKIERVLESWPEIVQYCHLAHDLSSHVIAKPQIPRYVEVRVTYLRDRKQRVTGKILVLRDITQNHQSQLQIRQVNTNLRLKLEQIQTLQAQLKEQAIRDSLTGLFNRRYFEETLPAERTKAERAGTTLSLVLMDIDHFKKVNDTYGHLAGDRALQVVSNLVHQQIRASDIACRYGGEEFILAMPNMPLAEAYQRAESIRKAIKKAVIEVDGASFQVTISMGLGAFPDFPGELRELLKRVDQALYVAKANGRDRIEIANEKTVIISKLSELENAIASSRTGNISRPQKTCA